MMYHDVCPGLMVWKSDVSVRENKYTVVLVLVFKIRVPVELAVHNILAAISYSLVLVCCMSVGVV